MFQISQQLSHTYEAFIHTKGISFQARKNYLKWLRHYFDFLEKYKEPELSDEEKLSRFFEKPRSENQSEEQRDQASHAVSLN